MRTGSYDSMIQIDIHQAPAAVILEDDSVRANISQGAADSGIHADGECTNPRRLGRFRVSVETCENVGALTHTCFRIAETVKKVVAPWWNLIRDTVCLFVHIHRLRSLALASVSRASAFVALTGVLGLLVSGCSVDQEETSPASIQEETSSITSTSAMAAEQSVEVGDYSEADYLRDTRVEVWDFDKTGKIRIENGQSICESLERNGWVSSDPEAVTLMFNNMNLSHTVETILTDAPDMAEVEGLEKSRYLVKYATKAYCPELYRDEIPSLEDVLTRQQEVDEKSSKLKDTLDSMN